MMAMQAMASGFQGADGSWGDSGCQGGSAPKRPRTDAASGDVDVEAFIAESNLDERAQMSLRDCSKAVQAAVIARGSLGDRSNPSSTLMGRLKDACAAERAARGNY